MWEFDPSKYSEANPNNTHFAHKHQEISKIILPLRLIFWGGLICVIDLSISSTANGVGWKIDILDDLVGMLMITWALHVLSSVKVNHSYKVLMTIILVIAVLASIEAFHDHFIYEIPEVISFLFFVFAIIKLLAIVAWCIAMRWLSIKAGLLESVKSWKVTTWLFIIIYLIPLGLFNLACIFAILLGESFYFNLGFLALLILPIFLVPLIHLFISTSRMKREILYKYSRRRWLREQNSEINTVT